MDHGSFHTFRATVGAESNHNYSRYLHTVHQKNAEDLTLHVFSSNDQRSKKVNSNRPAWNELSRVLDVVPTLRQGKNADTARRRITCCIALAKNRASALHVPIKD